jgi:CheY-like chemotaxis protein
VCQRISQDRQLGDVKVIAMTGYHSTENVERIKNAGAATCLAKPLDLKEVERVVRTLVGYQPAAST